MNGYSGSVIHAQGIVDGLLANHCHVELMAGPGSELFFERRNGLKLTAVERKGTSERRWRQKLLTQVLEGTHRNKCILVRYVISNPLMNYRLARYCKTTGCTSVVEVNSLLVHWFRFPRFIERIILKLEVFILRQFDVIYVVSNGLGKLLTSVDPELNIVVVPNGTKVRDIAPRKSVDSTHSRFLYLGNFHKYYDFTSLIDAYQNLPPAKRATSSLLFYGDGPLKSKLEDVANKIEGIHYKGRFDNLELDAIVNRETDILLLPFDGDKLCDIGSPVKLFEYLALGVPIIAASRGQVREIIKNGETGYLYNNVSELTEMMKKLIDDTGRYSVGENAHEDAISNHTWANRMKVLLSQLPA